MKAEDTDRPAVRRSHFQECICSVVSSEQWRVDLHLKLGLSFNVLLSFVFPLEELEEKKHYLWNQILTTRISCFMVSQFIANMLYCIIHCWPRHKIEKQLCLIFQSHTVFTAVFVLQRLILQSATFVCHIYIIFIQLRCVGSDGDMLTLCKLYLLKSYFLSVALETFFLYLSTTRDIIFLHNNKKNIHILNPICKIF